jgi:hypothetical protein
MKTNYILIVLATFVLIGVTAIVYISSNANTESLINTKSSSAIESMDFDSLTSGNNSCESIGMLSSHADIQADVRCLDRSLGHTLLKKIEGDKYQCTDSLGSSLTLQLKYYYQVPEYCDNDRAVLILKKELDTRILTLQELILSDDISSENREKFNSLVSIHQNFLEYTLTLNPYHSSAIEATNDFYQLLGTVGVQGTSQEEINSRIVEAQQKFDLSNKN